MFSDATWHLLISKLLSQPCIGDDNEIRTKATGMLNLVHINDDKIDVKTGRTNFKKYREVPREMIEAVYNELERTRTLSQQQISKGLNVKRSAFIIAALSLLPEIEYNRVGNSLKWAN